MKKKSQIPYNLIISFFTFLITTIAAILLESFFESKLTITLNTRHILIIFLVFNILISLMLYYHITKKSKDRENTERIKQLELDLKSKVNILNNDYKSEGWKAFLMALGLDNYESLKIDILHDAAIHKHHFLAGIYLGNLYFNGLKKDDTVIVEQDMERAFTYYFSVVDCDPTGLAAWRIGWMYEWNYFGKELDKKSRLQAAFSYYQKAAELDYPKSYNSLGKFYEHIDAIGKKDILKAISNYCTGANQGDLFAILNSAYIYSDTYNDFDLANECFLKATKFNNSLVWRKYGMFLAKYYNNTEHPDITIEQILDCYLASTKFNISLDSARSYVLIGKLVERYPNDIKQTQKDSILPHLDGNCQQRCYRRAYEIFQKVQDDGGHFTEGALREYNILKKFFAEK